MATYFLLNAQKKVSKEKCTPDKLLILSTTGFSSRKFSNSLRSDKRKFPKNPIFVQASYTGIHCLVIGYMTTSA